MYVYIYVYIHTKYIHRQPQTLLTFPALEALQGDLSGFFRWAFARQGGRASDWNSGLSLGGGGVRVGGIGFRG